MRRVLIATLAAAIVLSAQTNWKAPRTADGQPDLQGNWTNATLTPFQRPKELGNKEFFTPEEAAAFEKQRIQATDVDRVEGPRGAADLARRAYNNTWMDRGTHVTKYRRTSLVVDPPDGRVPPFTPEAQKRYDDFKAYLAKHASDGPEDRLLTERCILFGASGPPMLPEPYNNNYQIVQNRDFGDDSRGDESHGPHDPARWPSTCARRNHRMGRRFARPLGGRHAGCRDDQLQVQ